jgi:hypothetical protein
MFNLIETQQALKGLPLPDVLKYANGNNPTVPSYLALSELQRRKQIEDTSSAFYGQPPTVKEQIESGLTALPQGQVNPTQAPQGVNPTAMPPQLAPSPNMPPPMANPTAAPAGVQPNAAPPRMMAEGGLSGLPLPHMFRQTSYADGGIVYYGDPEKNPDEEQQVKTSRFQQMLPENLKAGNQRQKEYLDRNQGYRDLLEANKRGPGLFGQATAEEIARNDAELKAADERLRGKKPLGIDQNQMTAQDMQEGSDARSKVQPMAIPTNPNKQASNTSSALMTQPTTAPAPAKPPVMAEFKSKFDAGDMGTVQSPEDVYKQQQKIRALTGVSEDPLAKARERTSKLEAKYAQDSEDDARAGLMSILRGYAKAGSENPERGFGYAAASGSESAAKFDKEMKELRNNQMKEITTIKNLQDKEDDARKRGDAKGIEEAISAQKKAKMDLYKLQNEEKTSAAVYMNAQTNLAELPIKQQQANAQTNQSAASLINARRPTSEEFAYQMYKEDPTYFNAKNPKENAAVQAALKNYFEGVLSPKLQKDFPNPEAYLSSLGLATRAGGGNPTQTVKTKQEYDKLPSGTKYIGKDGQQYVKP